MYHLSSKGGVNSMHVTNFKNKRKRSEGDKAAQLKQSKHICQTTVARG